MRILLVVCLLISVNAFSQWKSYIIGVKGDTLNCVDMKGRKQGRWVVHVDEVRGERGYEEEGVYKDGKKEGTWRQYTLEGDISAIENYRWGNKDGKNIYFNNMGNIVREESWRAVDPENPYDTIDVMDPNDPSKIIGKQVVKLEGYSLKHGTWKFYDSFSGSVEKTENWYFDKPAHKNGDELVPIDVAANSENSTNASDATEKKKAPKPQAILDYEKKNAKKKIKVRDGQTGF